MQGGCRPLDPRLASGGYKVGEKLYYNAENYTFDDGDRLVHGEQGEVIGPGTGPPARMPALSQILGRVARGLKEEDQEEVLLLEEDLLILEG